MKALEGLKVIDMGNRLNGSFAAMVLADFGAEVVRVDRPGPGGAGFIYLPEDKMAAYWCTDRGKKSLVLNLKDEDAKEVFKRLCKDADVLIDGGRPGNMDKMGLGYDVLSEINPKLIYAALSSFGQTGPYRMRPGHDMNFVALSGAMSMIGERHGQVYMPDNLVADMGGAAMHGLAGILLALLAREKTGKGQFVDISYLDSVVSLLSFDVCSYFATGIVPHRGETTPTGSEVWGQVFRCKDGEYYSIGSPETKFWINLCNAIGVPELADSRTIATDSTLGEERKNEIKQKLAEVFLTKTRDEWAEILDKVDTCAAPVLNINEMVENEQIKERGMVIEMEHPQFGTVKQPGIAIKLSDTPGEVRGFGVEKGASSLEIAADLGFTPEEIAAMKEKGVFG